MSKRHVRISYWNGYSCTVRMWRVGTEFRHKFQEVKTSKWSYSHTQVNLCREGRYYIKKNAECSVKRKWITFENPLVVWWRRLGFKVSDLFCFRKETWTREFTIFTEVPGTHAEKNNISGFCCDVGGFSVWPDDLSTSRLPSKLNIVDAKSVCLLRQERPDGL